MLDLKGAVATVAALKSELAAAKKDIESLQSWESERKAEELESTRRRWAFGPSVVAALISGTVTILGLLINGYLNRPR